MHDHSPLRRSRLPSMGSHPCLLRPSICKSLEPTEPSARACPRWGSSRREEQSVRFRSGAPRVHTICCTRPRVALTFSFFLLLFSLARLQNEETSFSLFCLLATISLRIPWDAGNPKGF